MEKSVVLEDVLKLLDEEIRSDINERSELMARIKLFHELYKFSPEDKQIYLNYTAPIIYSIWEGFVQESFQAYIRALNKLDMNFRDILATILACDMESKFLQFKQYPTKPIKKRKFLQSLMQEYEKESLFISSKCVKTQGNVNFNGLNQILESFGLEKIDEYISENHTSPKYPIKNKLNGLVELRNRVAHGERPTEELSKKNEEINENINLIVKLMDLVLERITSGFECKSYLIAFPDLVRYKQTRSATHETLLH